MEAVESKILYLKVGQRKILQIKLVLFHEYLKKPFEESHLQAIIQAVYGHLQDKNFLESKIHLSRHKLDLSVQTISDFSIGYFTRSLQKCHVVSKESASKQDFVTIPYVLIVIVADSLRFEQALNKYCRVSKPPSRCTTSSGSTTNDSTPVVQNSKITLSIPAQVKDMLKDVKEVSDMSGKQLIAWLSLRTDILVGIAEGQVFSQRHNDYFKGNKSRAQLHYKVGLTHFNDYQKETLLKGLQKLFCPENENFSYVMSVLLPESIIQLIIDIYGVPRSAAERMMMLGERIPSSCDQSS